MIMDAESRRLYHSVVVVTLRIMHRKLSDWGGDSHKECGIIAWHLVPNSVPSECKLTKRISNPNSNL